jgi:hypothetical protein
MFDLEDVNIEEWRGGVCDLLISYSDVLDDVQDTDLLNLRDEMLGEFNQLKYLLTLNENMKKKKVIKLTENDLIYMIKRVMNENEDTSMDEYINWDIKSVDCEGSYLGNMSSMGVSEDKDGNPKVFIRYCKGDNEELNYLKRKARREIEQSNQLPSDDESLFENKNMTKKIIKLTEGDLMNIVKRVIKEQDENYKANIIIQCFLNKKGIKDNTGQSLKLDGSIGNLPKSKSAQAIANYQSKIGVEADGVWGYNTSTKMPPADKKLYDACFSENSGIIDKMAKGISDLFN